MATVVMVQCVKVSWCKEQRTSYSIIILLCLSDTDECNAASDIDECYTPLNVCSEHATCMNLPGSYLCQCDVGYRGNGTSCIGKSTNNYLL